MKIKSLLFVSLFFALGQGMWAQNPVGLPFQENFENGLDQWTVEVGSEAYAGISYDIGMGYESDHSFQFEYGAGNSYLYSPQFTGIGTGMRVSFYYTNYWNEALSSFRVGYFVQNDPVIHWIEEPIVAYNGTCYKYHGVVVGNPGWTLYERDFPANTQSIAIEFLGDKSNNLFLDNFSFIATSCPVPFDFGVFAIDEGINGGQSVSLSWNGSSDNYELQFAPFTVYDFESGGMAPWQGGTWKWSRGETYGDPSGHNSEHCVYSDLYPDEKNTLNENDNYLVSPWIKLNGSISFYAKKEPKETLKGHKTTDPETRFVVRVLTEHGNDYVSVGDPVSVSELAWEKYTIELNDPSFVDQNGYVAICHEYPGEEDYFLLIDDITFFSSWSSALEAITDNAYTFEDFEDNTQYVFQLRGGCGGDSYSSWTDPLYVKTFNPNAMPSSYEFLHDGNWNIPTNWKDWYIPQNGTDVVTISADAVIPACCLAKGNGTINGGSLTIRDGGQFIGNSVMARVLKHIVGYGEGDGNWYLLSAPTDETLNANPDYAPGDVVNLMPADNGNVHMFDLYSFDQTKDAEWQNFRQSEVPNKAFYKQQGLLYARKESATIEFNVPLLAAPNNTHRMVYDANAEFAGWNLVGNSMMCDQYVGLYQHDAYVSTDYYRMKADGTGLELCSNGAPVAPMEGFFVQAPDDAEYNVYLRFSSTPVQIGNSKSIDVEVTADNTLVDRARVRFGEGSMLGKFTLNENSSKLYISQSGKDYAVVRSDGQGEMPVNFKASKNGNYTISVNAENTEMNYMHLIDNLTGADIDLLATPSYSFEAKTTDYASRFRLVFR